MLLATNADPNIRTKREEIYHTGVASRYGRRLFDHWSPLRIAIHRKNRDIIRLLKDVGAISYGNTRHCLSDTPMHR